MNKKELLDHCLSLVNEDEIIRFTQDLVKIESYPPAFNERDVAVAVAAKFAEYGIAAQIDDLGDNRANIIASIGEQKAPHIMLSGHMDTVPPVEGWDYDPFGAEIIDGKMYGRGTGDMKGGVASLVMAMCYLNKAGISLPCKLSFLGTAGEEAGLEGALAYMDQYGSDDIDAMIIAEASNRDLNITQMGALWIHFTARGVAAHPGVSHQGVNALLNTMKFFERFCQYDFGVSPHPLLGLPTLNVTTMHAGQITNALPTLCTSTVDIRTIPGVRHKDILAEIDRIIAELKAEDPRFDLTYETPCNIESSETSLEDPLCQAAFQASRDVFGHEITPIGSFFNTDACVMQKSDGSSAPLIVYGPGDSTNNHKINEFVEVAQLVEATKFYIATILNYIA